MDKPKYSLLEIERRWLVQCEHADGLLAGTSRIVRDKYLSDTRLRPRRVTAGGTDEVYKLCKKYGDRHNACEAITNLYLSHAEYVLLDQLPGTAVTKWRRIE